MKKILIYGINSLKNRGCEALVNSTIYQIDKDVELTAATFDYDHDKEFYKDRIKKWVKHHKHDEKDMTEEEKELHKYYQSIPFDYNNFELLYQNEVTKEMENADISIHIGGDNYCYGVNEWMYSLNTYAKKIGKKTVLWGASLYDEITDLKLIEDLKKYDLLMLREKISYNAIKKYIDEEKLMLVPDCAFSLKPKKVKLNPWYENRKILGINLSPLVIKSDENLKAAIDLMKYILKATDYDILLVPHVTVSESDDMKILRKLKKEFTDDKRVYLEEGNFNCQEIKYIISKCDLLIAARTHASIAAYSTNIPTLVIGYSVKSRGIAEDIFGNYKDYVLPTEEISFETLKEKFDYLNTNQNKIKKILKNRTKEINEEAKTLYSRMIERLEYLDSKKICPKEKCIGCGLCKSICPNQAITMKEDKEGFNYTDIDLSKCTNCGLCRKKCVVNNKKNDEKQQFTLKAYAAKAKDKDMIMRSSSGGVFYYLAKEIISQNGIVYGATMNSFKVEHIKIEREEDIHKIQGSKYSQSNLKNVLKDIEKDLKANKKVLFSGTPCQVLALNKYLNKSYKNLYTVSVICHGVMNDKILEKRIGEIEKNLDSQMDKVVYKSKKQGWDKSSIEYQTDRINKYYSFQDDPMMYLYVNNYILRESCYDCPAKGLDNNVADIVLGDYWGIYNVHRELFDHIGTSAIMVKTKQGDNLLKKVTKYLNLTDTKYEDIIKANESFLKSMEKPIERNVIFKDLEDNTFDLIAKNFKKQEKNPKEAIVLLTEQKNQAELALQQVYNSKRFRMIDKIGNLKNKIVNKIKRK